MSRLPVAVIGAGHLGRIHARLLAAMPDVELVAVVDPDAAARTQVAADCRTEALADHRQILHRAQAAVVATPTRFHHQVAMDLLRGGVHLLVEKPLTSTLGEGQELVDAAAKYGLTLQVGHIERFNPALTAVREHLQQPKFVEAVRAGGFTFRSTDIGVVLDLMIHDLDVVLDLVDSPLRSVDAFGLALLGRNEDVARAHLEFENGTVADLSACRVSPHQRRQMQLWTERGYGSIDFAERKATLVRPSEALVKRELDPARLSSEARQELKERIFQDHLRVEELAVPDRNALLDELEDFKRAIRTSTAPRVDGRQACRALAVAEQILAKIGTHRWSADADGPSGPLATPLPSTLRGPHWRYASDEVPRREAG